MSREPRKPPDMPDDLWEEATGQGVDPEANGRAATRGGAEATTGHHLTDLGNAERLVARHGNDLRYVHKWGKWLVWDEKRWALDESGEVERRAAKTVSAIYAEAEHADGKDKRRAIARHATASESRSRIDAMIALARSRPGIPVAPDDLDADPWVLNVQNGTVDLKTEDLRPHRRDDLITKLAPVEYDPDAQAPRFEAFLEEILPAADVRGFLQRAIGYALNGTTREHKLPVLHGGGSNGKGTLAGVILEVFGDYGLQAADDLLMAKRGDHPTERADLFGRRFVANVETERDHRLSEALVKRLTGGDRIRARRMREDFWEFDPTHTLFLATNHRPEIKGTDHAIWRRVRLVPFNVTIPEQEQDKALPEKLRDELPGILAWAVRGHAAWLSGGLDEPKEVTDATEGYRADMDTLGAFLEDRCVVHPRAEAPATPLYKTYQEWCADSGENCESQKKFGGRLRERGFEGFTYTSGPHTDRRGWRGIGLQTTPPDGGGDGQGKPPGPDDQTRTSDAKRDQGAPEAPKTGADGPGPDDPPDDRPGRESGTGIGISEKPPDGPDDTGPKNDIKHQNIPREAVMSEIGPGSSDRPVSGAVTPRDDGRRLTPDEAERIQRLIAQGMGAKWARAEVLGEG